MNVWTQLDDIIHSIRIHRLIPAGLPKPGRACEDSGVRQEFPVCHADFTVFCILEGTCGICIDSREQLILSPSEVLLLPPGLPAVFSLESPALCLAIQINPAFLLHTLNSDALFACCHSSLEAPQLRQLATHLKSLSRLYLTEKEPQHYQILGSLYSCVQILHTWLVSRREIQADTSASPSARFADISDYIARHIQEPLTLQDTAAAMNLTPQYLASCFQKAAGCTFLSYVANQKAKASLPWLSYTGLSDSEIADAFGLRNAAALQKCIREHFHDTTENIRKQSRLFRASFSTFPPGTVIKEPLGYLASDLPESYAGSAGAPAPAQTLQEETAVLMPATDIPLSLQKKMSDSWRYILNVGFASQLTDARLRSQIMDIQNQLHFRYGRICRLLDLTLFHQINGKNYYGFEIIFQTLDFFLSMHLTPFLELGFKSEKIHSHFTETYILSPEKDILSYYDKLLSILPDFMRSCCNRYGQDIVSGWCFEVYYDQIEQAENLHEITFGHYADYLKRILSVIRSAVPGCRIGGTGFNTYLPFSSLKQELSTLRSMEMQLDFFSIYVYGAIGHDFSTHLTLDKDLVLDKTRQAISLIHQYFPELPVLVTEFSFCYSSRSYLNDSLFQSSFILRYLVQQLNNVQGIGYFTLSDLNVRYRDTDEFFFGGNGLYNIHGIRKPSYYAYAFFHHLGAFLLGKGDHYIFTANSRSSIQGILFHYTHIDQTLAYSEHGEELLAAPTLHFEPTPAGQMQFMFTDVLPGSYIIKRYRITRQAANPLNHWSKYHYFHSLTEEDLRFFQYLSHPEADLSVIEVQNGEPMRLSFTIKPQEVQLLLIELSLEPPKEEFDEIQK